MSVDPHAGIIATLVVFVALSFVDGIVIHLWRERLHRRPGSRLEHALHTARAALFPFILVLFFAGANPALGLVLIGVDQLVEFADMAVERRSRAYSGGLKSSEYLLHGTLITLRAVGITLAVIAGPPSATLLSLVDLLLPGAIAAAILHVVLIVPLPRRATA